MFLSMWKAWAVGAMAISAVAAQQEFTYQYNVTAAGNLLLDFSGRSLIPNSTGPPYASTFTPEGTRMVFNDTDTRMGFVQFEFGGRGFCLYGDLPPNVWVALNPNPNAVTTSQIAWNMLTTDGRTLCYGQDAPPGYNTYRVQNLNAVDSVTLDLVSSIPPGFQESDLVAHTTPFVLNGQPNPDPMFSYSSTPTVYNRDGVDGLYFNERSGVVKINSPPNAAFFVLNTARGRNLGGLYITASPAFPYPITKNIWLINKWWTSADTAILVQSLDTSKTYEIILNTVPATDTGSYALNLTSVTFYQFGNGGNGSTSTSTATTDTGAGANTASLASSTDTDVGRAVTPTSSGGNSNVDHSNSGAQKKSSNAGAIAGGVVGGVVGLAALAALIWFLCRRRKKNTYEHGDQFEVDSGMSGGIRPYDAPQTTNTGQFVTAPMATQLPQPQTAKSYEAMHGQHGPTPVQHAGAQPNVFYYETTALGSQPSPMASSSSAGLLSPHPQAPPSMAGSSSHGWSSNSGGPIHEEDAGAVDPPARNERLPPMYNPNWRASDPAAETQIK